MFVLLLKFIEDLVVYGKILNNLKKNILKGKVNIEMNGVLVGV